METRLFFVGGGSDKEYHVFLDEDPTAGGMFQVHARFGPAGRLSQLAKKINGATLDKAVKVFDRTVASKTKKGYQIESETDIHDFRIKATKIVAEKTKAKRKPFSLKLKVKNHPVTSWSW
jgi:hypothetical protein